MTTLPQRNTSEAVRAVGFARRHDWGKDATINGNDDTGFTVAGLIDWQINMNGGHSEWVAVRCAVPACMAAVREFGNY